MLLKKLLPVVAASCFLANAVAAQDTTTAQENAFDDGLRYGTLSTRSTDRRLIFTFLLGGESRPSYFGSGDNEGIVKFSPNLLSLNLGQLQLGDEADAFDDDPNDFPLGLVLGASFRYIGDREAADHPELTGMQDLDAALEVGGKIGYAWPKVEAFADVRYGVTGHKSWVGELSAYYVARPADKFVLRFGPRLLFGTDRYTSTYFGVTPAEAAASAFNAYNAGGGLVSAGVEMIGTYQISDRWWLEGRARWDKLQGDAASSPIVVDDEMLTVSLGLRRAFVLDF
ncbi:MipA/OmpV family protein [Lutimaribacter marinistellae]|uniref:MipA/OmpV family protein n=1 Tax=Lutimaribacter marinistellae TaxID=1820329 RepID=A0ABV7TDK5_9RHOB